jgi:hypothetical protein
MAEKIINTTIYNEKDLIELAILEQFANHHLNGDIDTAKKIFQDSKERNDK